MLFRQAAVGAFVLTGIVVGCSTFGGDDPSPSNADDAGVDSGPASNDAGAGTIDGQPQSDSGDAGLFPNHFCTTIDAAFCADFEEGPLNNGHWTRVLTSNANATGELSQVEPRSAPNVFAVRTHSVGPDAATATKAAFAVVSRDVLRQNHSKVAVDFDMIARSVADAGNYMAVASIVFSQTVPKHYISMTVSNSNSSIAIYNPNLHFEQAGLIPNGWFHVRFEIDALVGAVKLFYNNVPVASTPNAGVVSVEAAFSVDVGAYVVQADGEYAVDYDNVITTFLD